MHQLLSFYLLQWHFPINEDQIEEIFTIGEVSNNPGVALVISDNLIQHNTGLLLSLFETFNLFLETIDSPLPLSFTSFHEVRIGNALENDHGTWLVI